MKIQNAIIISCLSSFVIGVGAGILVGVTAAKKHYENEEKERVPQEVIDEICRVGNPNLATKEEIEEKAVYEDPEVRATVVSDGEPDISKVIEDVRNPIPRLIKEQLEKESEHKFVDYSRFRYAPEHGDIDEDDPRYEKKKPHFVEQDVVLNDDEIDCVPLTYYKGDRVLVCEDGIGPDVIDEVDARDMLGDCLREIENSDVGEVYVLNEINNRYYEVSIVDGWFEDPNPPEDYLNLPKVEKIRKRRQLDG